MKGLIFIPDINGFTNFVQTIPVEIGSGIIHELLNIVIDNNDLDMELSEVEGDAILFYRIGNPIPVPRIMTGAEKIIEAFNFKYESLKDQYNLAADLSLKFIVHYGEILVYDIRGFKKLYGEIVIESHRLLKNGSEANDYILVTEDYLEAEQRMTDQLSANTISKSHKCHLFSGLKKVAYYLFNGRKNKLALETVI